MRKLTGLILGLVLLFELGVAVLLVLAQPKGFGSLLDFDIDLSGIQHRQELAPQTFETNGTAGAIVVQSDSGQVQVVGVAGSTQVVVRATKVTHSDNSNAFDRMSFGVEQRGKDIYIEVKRAGEPVINLLGNDRVELQISAPTFMEAQINTNNGTISASNFDNLDARHRFESQNGRITLSNIKATLVEVYGHNGQLNLDTISGTLQGETNNGQITARDVNVNVTSLRSDNGQIELQGKLQQTSNGSIQTHNGSVQLRLTEDSPVRFDASTGTGQVRFGLASQTFSLQQRNHVVTTGSGPLINVRADNGNVTIERS